MMDALERRARQVRARVAVRAWEYRQRKLSKGVWFRLRRVLVDASSAALLERHRVGEEERLRKLEDFFERSGLDFIRIGTDRPFIDPIIRFFRRRAKRLRR